ncbi:hypothetical protein [Edaphobacter aggregans]|uniref:hypothetical protein n=1 Tax=Edaphobacter aggregans TaxID=570835 RepID=UPI00163B357D|nr:hypothetical protein [Edaphobacter aggregans]
MSSLNQPQKDRAPTHRSLIAMSGNVRTSPSQLRISSSTPYSLLPIPYLCDTLTVMPRYRLPFLIIPIAALIAILPLILQGCSCGHDFDFHLLNWFEAAHQFTHGNLHPTWAYTPAWNAGEPRFIFYPPISWILGAILGLILPWTWTPIAYTWLALTAAGFALYYLAKTFATPNAALLAATFYVVNPYTLFTAYERTAYAELLAAAWIPLLLHAILRNKVTIPRIAIPLALLWLTNAPAAVMASYTLALLTLIRIFVFTNSGAPSAPAAEPSARFLRLRWASRESATAPANIALKATIGTLLGLALAAFYIVPAAYQRRFVQINMAILPGLHPQDNFLFHHTLDADHDQVLRTASIIAVILILLTVTALLLARIQTKPPSRNTTFLTSLAILTLTITLLLTPLSAPLWHHLPELRFLQFPWRLLAILAPTLSLTLALALSHINLKSLPTTLLSIAIAASLTYAAYHFFHQPCDLEDTVAARLAHFRSSNPASEPTDEYTPITADNDALAPTNPPYWLADNPEAPSPTNTPPGPAPTHLALNPTTPKILILNRRDYPTWSITRNGTPIYTRLSREDGLIAIPLPASPSEIAITPIRTTDQLLGYLITAIAILALILLRRADKIRDRTSAQSSPRTADLSSP